MKNYLLLFSLSVLISLSNQTLQAQADNNSQKPEKNHTIWQVSLHAGGGLDLNQAGTSEREDYILRESSYGIYLTNPFMARLRFGFQIGDHWRLFSGFGIANRNFQVDYFDPQTTENVGIRYTVTSIPVEFSYRQPLSDRFALIVGLGGSFEQSGGFESLLSFGPIDSGNEGDYVLFSATHEGEESRVFGVSDKGFKSYFKFFSELEYQLRKNVKLSLRVGYNFSNTDRFTIGEVRMIDYDNVNEEKAGTISASDLNFDVLGIDLGVAYDLN